MPVRPPVDDLEMFACQTMPTTRDAGFQELVRVLEETIQAGVTSVGFEYNGGELLVFHRVGNVGLGVARIHKELQQSVIEALVNRAGLTRKSKGKMRVTLLA